MKIMVEHIDGAEPRYYNVTTDQQMHAAALCVVEQRLPDNYSGDEARQAIAAIKRRDGQLAMELLDSRSGIDGEKIEFVRVLNPVDPTDVAHG